MNAVTLLFLVVGAASRTLSWEAKDAGASTGHQLGAHPTHVATHGSWTLASAQTSSVSFCPLALTLGSMMSAHNVPAESFIHPIR